MKKFKKALSLAAAFVMTATMVNVGSLTAFADPVVLVVKDNKAVVKIAQPQKLEISVDGTLKDNSTAQNAFKVEIDGKANNPDAATATAGNKIVLDLTDDVLHTAKKVKVTYKKSDATGTELTVNDKQVDDFVKELNVDVSDYFLPKSTAVEFGVFNVQAGSSTVKVPVVEGGLSATNSPFDTSDKISKSGITVKSVDRNKAFEITTITVNNAEIEIAVKNDNQNKFLKGETITVSYDPEKAATLDDVIKKDSKVVYAISKTDKVQDANTEKTTANVTAVVANGEAKKSSTTSVEVTFNQDVAEKAKEYGIANLNASNFAVKDGKAIVRLVEKGSKANSYKVYTDLSDKVKQDEEIELLITKAGFEFNGSTKAKVNVSDIGSSSTGTDGKGKSGSGSFNSSVRPGTSTTTPDTKKEEPKKEEPKKEEPKAQQPVVTESKVSTKLVIGQKEYTVMENGNAVKKSMDVAPMVHKGRTVLPARMISELLGVGVNYNSATRTASFMLGDNTVKLTLGQKNMDVNGKKVALSGEVVNVGGRILLPVRDIQKAFAELGLNASVEWDAATKSVTINK